MFIKSAVLMSAFAIFGQGIGGGTTDVPVRLVVEPAYPSPFPEEIILTFTNAEGTAVGYALVSETVRATSFTGTRGGLTGEVRLPKDGKFHVTLPRSRQFRLIVRVRPNPGIVPATQDRYFLSSVRTGNVNLLEKPLVLTTTPSSEEIVITLAKCTEKTQDQAECK